MNRTYSPQKRTVNLVYMNGGVGDHMASLVATDYAIKQYPWIKYLVFVPDFLLDFAKHVLPPKTTVHPFSSMRKTYDHTKPTKTTQWNDVSPMKIHTLDYAFLKLCDENPGLKHKNYLKIKPDLINISQFNLPKDYIVITTGFTAEVREFPAKEINLITAWARVNNIEAVFLGQNNTDTGTGKHTIQGTFRDDIDYSAGLNLIDKTSLLEAAKIMHESKAVLGVDNGLLHIAGCTDANIIGGYTSVAPELRLPVRNDIIGYRCHSVLPDASLACKFCQSSTNFLYGHDYKYCMYKDNLCTKQMTATKFIKHLEIL